jgi:hypothetical protein
MQLTPSTKDMILFVGGLLGIIAYVVLPSLRDPILIPVYLAMIGLPIVMNKDKK